VPASLCSSQRLAQPEGQRERYARRNCGIVSACLCRKSLVFFLASGAYLAAGLEFLALGVDALVVVDVVLPAVLGLVLVREAGVESWWIRGLARSLPDMANVILTGVWEGGDREWCRRTGWEAVSISALKLSQERAHKTHQSRT
jgi:hypothetical protein